jgi:hypothetical protein
MGTVTADPWTWATKVLLLTSPWRYEFPELGMLRIVRELWSNYIHLHNSQHFLETKVAVKVFRQEDC